MIITRTSLRVSFFGGGTENPFGMGSTGGSAGQCAAAGFRHRGGSAVGVQIVYGHLAFPLWGLALSKAASGEHVFGAAPVRARRKDTLPDVLRGLLRRSSVADKSLASGVGL
jgi:hypothetical protein